jgi:hypothetical protein
MKSSWLIGQAPATCSLQLLPRGSSQTSPYQEDSVAPALDSVLVLRLMCISREGKANGRTNLQRPKPSTRDIDFIAPFCSHRIVDYENFVPAILTSGFECRRGLESLFIAGAQAGGSATGNAICNKKIGTNFPNSIGNDQLVSRVRQTHDPINLADRVTQAR